MSYSLVGCCLAIMLTDEGTCVRDTVWLVLLRLVYKNKAAPGKDALAQ